MKVLGVEGAAGRETPTLITPSNEDKLSACGPLFVEAVSRKTMEDSVFFKSKTLSRVNTYMR